MRNEMSGKFLSHIFYPHESNVRLSNPLSEGTHVFITPKTLKNAKKLQNTANFTFLKYRFCIL